MIGAIIGDISGSVFEGHNNRSKDFYFFDRNSHFTDDSVLTFATAKVLLDGGDYTYAYQTFARAYPDRGYGGGFRKWMWQESPQPYNSFGNGSAMRVAPIGFAFADAETTLAEAKRSAEVTHNHPEGIKGAQAVALAIWMGRHGIDKVGIRESITKQFNYDLSRNCDYIRIVNKFDATCQGSVPEAITCFLESTNFEDCIRLAISIGGDSDTIACIAGGIAQAYYGEIPEWIIMGARARLNPDLMKILDRFENQFLLDLA
ncbi:MAG TPA: ADP-ribosylglycohydrolase family protein [Anaerolineaceae bacterium]|nr:ADP-ribosylglycohydrolase family protein [Anaerolineaceae bacterium]